MILDCAPNFGQLPQAGSFIETRGACLHYLSKNVEAGKDKPVFVLMHGSSANARDMMLALGDELAAYEPVRASTTGIDARKQIIR